MRAVKIDRVTLITDHTCGFRTKCSVQRFVNSRNILEPTPVDGAWEKPRNPGYQIRWMHTSHKCMSGSCRITSAHNAGDARIQAEMNATKTFAAAFSLVNMARWVTTTCVLRSHHLIQVQGLTGSSKNILTLQQPMLSPNGPNHGWRKGFSTTLCMLAWVDQKQECA